MPTTTASRALTDPCTWPAWRLARLIVEEAAEDAGEALELGEALTLAAILVAELDAARDAAERAAV